MPENIPTTGIGFRLPRDYQAIIPEWVDSSRVEVRFETDADQLPPDSEEAVLYFIAPPADGLAYDEVVEPILHGRTNAVIILCTPRPLLLPTRTSLLRIGISAFVTGQDSASRVREVLAMAVARSDWTRGVLRAGADVRTAAPADSSAAPADSSPTAAADTPVAASDATPVAAVG